MGDEKCCHGDGSERGLKNTGSVRHKIVIKVLVSVVIDETSREAPPFHFVSNDFEPGEPGLRNEVGMLAAYRR